MRGYVPWIGINPYGVPPSTHRVGPHWRVETYREAAMNAAQKIYAATSNPNIGYRWTPWGSEAVVFGTLAGLDRWSNEQGHDTDVWYAATFNLLASPLPAGEIMR